MPSFWLAIAGIPSLLIEMPAERLRVTWQPCRMFCVSGRLCNCLPACGCLLPKSIHDRWLFRVHHSGMMNWRVVAGVIVETEDGMYEALDVYRGCWGASLALLGQRRKGSTRWWPWAWRELWWAVLRRHCVTFGWRSRFGEVCMTVVEEQ